MAIIPEDITTVRVDQLPSEPATLASLLVHQVGTDLKQTTVETFITLVATAIESGSGVGFLPVSVTDGQTLPAIPENPSFILVGAGTFINLDGFPDLVCTENLNALMTVDTHWEIAVEIPINPLTGTVESVTGSAVDNTDPLNPVINLQATPTLQQVTTEGATTTNTIEIDIDEAEAIVFYSGGDVVGSLDTTNDGLEFKTTDVLAENNSIYRNGNIVVRKNSGSPKTHQLPINEDGTFDLISIIVSANKTAENDAKYTVIANATFTDPTPAEGKGYTVFVRNGTATIGGVGYTAVSLVYRVYHSGAWGTYNQSGFIPITGTTTGNEVTGIVEFKDPNGDITVKIMQGDGDENGRIDIFGNATVGTGNFSSWGLGSFYGSSDDGATQYQFQLSSDKGISNNVDVSANITDLDYTQKIYVDSQFGRLIALTETEILALTPENGRFYYNTDINCPVFYDGTEWKKVSNTTM